MIMDAFYTAKRSDVYPLAVNDTVLVKKGKKPGMLAAVISVESEAPQVTYLIEYGDGSDDIVPLTELELKEPNQPPEPTAPSGRGSP